MCLAGNVDALEDDVAGLDDVSLDSESELSSDEIEISSSAAQTRSSSLLSSLVRSVSSNPSLASFIIFIISVVSNPIFFVRVNSTSHGMIAFFHFCLR